jgi:hypothetical protein
MGGLFEEAVLAYLARYTYRVAISNRRLIAADAMGITFKYKEQKSAAATTYGPFRRNEYRTPADFSVENPFQVC